MDHTVEAMTRNTTSTTTRNTTLPARAVRRVPFAAAEPSSQQPQDAGVAGRRARPAASGSQTIPRLEALDEGARDLGGLPARRDAGEAVTEVRRQVLTALVHRAGGAKV